MPPSSIERPKITRPFKLILGFSQLQLEHSGNGSKPMANTRSGDHGILFETIWKGSTPLLRICLDGILYNSYPFGCGGQRYMRLPRFYAVFSCVPDFCSSIVSMGQIGENPDLPILSAVLPLRLKTSDFHWFSIRLEVWTSKSEVYMEPAILNIQDSKKSRKIQVNSIVKPPQVACPNFGSVLK